MPDPLLRTIEFENAADATGDHRPSDTTDAHRITAPMSEAASADLPEVPGYRIVREIARGGMGRVLAARDLSLDREVAIKVLLPGASADRFVRESLITARLPHPGIPPVYALGTLADGAHFLAMKLVEGRTLLDELKVSQRADLIGVFAQICQAVGFAHSRGIIHRDLKPANVMLGAFGEVQVMDWGLAKELQIADCRLQIEKPEPTTCTDPSNLQSAICNLQSEETQAGAILGTPGYMAPEQAQGLATDARSDVFALGGILYTLLTGQPPFGGGSVAEVVRRAATADLADAYARLDRCGADAELVTLCRCCLSADPAGRPANGQAVAEAVAAYRAGVEERLRQVEHERAATAVRQAEQRKRRRVTLALGLALGLLLLGGGVFGWWQNDRLGRNAEAVSGLLDQCDGALQAADAAKAAVTLEAAQKRAAEGGAGGLTGRLRQCQEDLAVLHDLDAIDQFRWTPVGHSRKFPDGAALAARYREALGRFGADPDAASPAAAAARLSASAVQEQLVAALDRLLQQEKTAGVRETLRLADPEPFRDVVRDAVRAGDGVRVAELAARPAALEQPGWFAAVLGEETAVGLARRRELLAAAIRQRPSDLPLLMALGGTYRSNKREGADERTRWYQAAVAVAPGNLAAHNNLGAALDSNLDREGALAEYREALRLDPKYTSARINLANVLRDKMDVEGALAEFREAIRLDPKDAHAHGNLAETLRFNKGDYEGALAECREALRLDPKSDFALTVLGNTLWSKGDLDGAIVEYRKALRLDPNDTDLHTYLAVALTIKGDLDGALVEYREAVRLDPKNALARSNLSQRLMDNGDLEGALAECREAVRLNPNLSWAHHALGNVLRDKGDLEGAIASYREAVRVNRKDDNEDLTATLHNNLGNALRDKGDLDGAIAAYREAVRLDPKNALAPNNLAEAERQRPLLARLPAVLAGRAEPRTPAENCDFAELCALPFQKRFAAAVRLYQRAFAADAKLADDLIALHRYNAACHAARAARGDGLDAPSDSPGRAALRGLALSWLRADLTLRRKQADSADAALRKTAGDRLSWWLSDPDLKELRPGSDRSSLQSDERSIRDALWVEVKAIIAAAQKPRPAVQKKH